MTLLCMRLGTVFYSFLTTLKKKKNAEGTSMFHSVRPHITHIGNEIHSRIVWHALLNCRIGYLHQTTAPHCSEIGHQAGRRAKLTERSSPKCT